MQPAPAVLATAAAAALRRPLCLLPLQAIAMQGRSLLAALQLVHTPEAAVAVAVMVVLVVLSVLLQQLCLRQLSRRAWARAWA